MALRVRACNNQIVEIDMSVTVTVTITRNRRAGGQEKSIPRNPDRLPNSHALSPEPPCALSPKP
jgi:hypothetical protein